MIHLDVSQEDRQSAQAGELRGAGREVYET